MPPVKIALKEYYEGDSWVGMAVGPIVMNGSQPANPLAEVRLQFRNVEDESVVYELTSNNTAVDTPTTGKGYIAITDANTWEIAVPAQIIGIAEGKWKWDFECTDSTGFRITPYRGILKVKGDVTHD